MGTMKNAACWTVRCVPTHSSSHPLDSLYVQKLIMIIVCSTKILLHDLSLNRRKSDWFSIKVHDSLDRGLTREDTRRGSHPLWRSARGHFCVSPVCHAHSPSDYNSPSSRTEITSVVFSRFRRPY